MGRTSRAGVVVGVCLVLLGHVGRGVAAGQTSHQLIPVLTEQTPIAASNQYGTPLASVVNDAGDFAFLGARGTALFYRRAGWANAIRAIQYGDDVPGLPGARFLSSTAPLRMNASGLVATSADVLTTSGVTQVMLTFDGATVRTIVTALDVAPGTGGAKFERTMTLVDLNGNGDVLFGATLTPPGSASPPLPSVFLIPFLATPVRVAGPGDVPPGTGGTFGAVTPLGLSDGGMALLSASITGGSGLTGLFAWQGGVLRKIVAQGDATPIGGTFGGAFAAPVFTVPGIARVNSADLVMFAADGGAGGRKLWQNTALDGTTLVFALGDLLPGPLGGTLSSVATLEALSSSGHAAFIGGVDASSSDRGLFVFRPGTGVEVVARVGEPVPGMAGTDFGAQITPGIGSAFTSISMNAAGTVSFQGNANLTPLIFGLGHASRLGFVEPLPAGLFQKPAGGALAALILHGAAAPGGGSLFLENNAPQTLATGAVLLGATIVDGPDATFGLFLWSGTPATLMTNADLLPPGARLALSADNFLPGRGPYLGFNVQRAGGRVSIGVFSPALQTVAIAATDGDPVAGTGGSRLRFSGAAPAVMVNAQGDAFTRVHLLGGPGFPIRSGVIAGGITQPVAAVTFDGATDTGGRVLTDALLNAHGVRPISVNGSGAVIFTARADGASPDTLFVGSTSSMAQKVAQIGDVASDGSPLLGIEPRHAGINDAGQVLFAGSYVSGVQVLYQAVQGQPALKLVEAGEPSPVGGTFGGCGENMFVGLNPGLSFNNSGQVAFVACTGPGPNGAGGVFQWSAGNPIEVIAASGPASPAGGTFAFTLPHADIVMNDLGHILFMADVSGGLGDSGLFIKRGPLASLEVVARQGQAAPGTPGVFSTFPHAPFSSALATERFQISSTGEVAFVAEVTLAGGAQMTGWWHVDTAGAMQPMVLVPSAPGEFEGETAGRTSIVANWVTANQFVVHVQLANGPHGGGFYLYSPITEAATVAGSNVEVTAKDAVTGAAATITFATVSAPGSTSVTRRSTGPALPRGWYRAGAPGAFYDIRTTATVSGPITVCVDFADHAFATGAVIRLLHHENGAWQDITTAGPTGSSICGLTPSLSPFVVAHALNTPSSNAVQNGTFDNGATNWSVFATDGTNPDPGYISWSVNAGVFEYFRVPPPPGAMNSAVVLQNTGLPFAAGDPIVSHFEIGNTSSVRKRIGVLIHDADFGDLSVCTFWIPPNTPLRPYAMRTHTTAAWSNASISFYAASEGAHGGAYQLDNVVLGPGHALTTGRTDCVDPGEPGVAGTQDGAPLLTNGNFTDGLNGWTAFGTITAQVTGGVAEFIRPSNAAPSGALLQPSGAVVAGGQVLTATFQLGNSSAARKRVTVVLHDLSFGDLAACTFWLPAGQSLSSYSMRTYTTQAWGNATIAFYPATTDQLGWFRLDNVSMSVTPSAPTYGTDCAEPGNASGLTDGPPALQPHARGLQPGATEAVIARNSCSDRLRDSERACRSQAARGSTT